MLFKYLVLKCHLNTVGIRKPDIQKPNGKNTKWQPKTTYVCKVAHLQVVVVKAVWGV